MPAIAPMGAPPKNYLKISSPIPDTFFDLAR